MCYINRYNNLHDRPFCKHSALDSQSRTSLISSNQPYTSWTSEDSSYVQRKCGIFFQTREDIIDTFARIVGRASSNTQLARRLLLQKLHRLYNFDCYEQAVDLFHERCYNLSEVTFIPQFRCLWSLPIRRYIEGIIVIKRKLLIKDCYFALNVYVPQRIYASCYDR